MGSERLRREIPTSWIWIGSTTVAAASMVSTTARASTLHLLMSALVSSTLMAHGVMQMEGATCMRQSLEHMVGETV
jgi:hypothetical protein